MSQPLNEVIDYELYNDISSYLRYRRDCFNNYIQYIANDDYDHIINSRYAKVSRIKKRLLYLLLHRRYIYFLTFTFDDDFLTRCDRSKKDLIKNSLKSFDDDVLIILNRDFGGLKGREHYHAILGTDNSSNIINYLHATYPYRSNAEKVNNGIKNIKKLSKYINKLTNHCCKDSTFNSRLYFNFKGFDNLDPLIYKIARHTFLVKCDVTGKNRRTYEKN